MTYDDFVARALTRPEVVANANGKEENVTRGTHWMFSLKHDGEMVAIKLGWTDHDRLLAAHPRIVFKTPHYEGYPVVLVRLETLTPDLADELIDASWVDAPERARKMPR